MESRFIESLFISLMDSLFLISFTELYLLISFTEFYLLISFTDLLILADYYLLSATEEFSFKDSRFIGSGLDSLMESRLDSLVGSDLVSLTDSSFSLSSFNDWLNCFISYLFSYYGESYS